jgi:hypothetical protein
MGSSGRVSSGGGGAAATVESAYITTGDINPLPLTSGAWQAVTGFDLAIAATVGQRLKLEPSFMWKPGSGNSALLDFAVKVGGSLVRFLSSGTATPAVEGDPAIYIDSATYRTSGVVKDFVVTSGDIDSGSDGKVHLVLACKTSASVGVVYASTSYPFYWRAEAQ